MFVLKLSGIQMLSCSQKLVWNVCIKAIWYTKVYFVVENWCEMFVLKLSGIQMLSLVKNWFEMFVLKQSGIQKFIL